MKTFSELKLDENFKFDDAHRELGAAFVNLLREEIVADNGSRASETIDDFTAILAEILHKGSAKMSDLDTDTEDETLEQIGKILQKMRGQISTKKFGV